MIGKFISIEGVEGSGKSTQLDFIADYLSQRGKQVVVTREPGGTELGEKLRLLLLTENMSVMTELLLIFAARNEHILKVIMPALKRGDWVVSDRFTDATVAYQGGGRGAHPKQISKIADWTLHDLQPDMTLLFNLPAKLGQKRVAARQQKLDRFEQENDDFFERVRACYLTAAQREPDRIKIIDASKSIQDVAKQVAFNLDKIIL